MVILGRTYNRSRTRRNTKLAFELCKKAYDLGYSPAANDLAVCYAKGVGTPQDINKCLEIYKKAVSEDEDPYPEIIYSLGQWYQHYSVPQDLRAAVVCYREAAKKGLIHAIELLKTKEFQDYLELHPEE
jgi:hypothetical protein